MVGLVGMARGGSHAERLLQKSVAGVMLVVGEFQENTALVWQWGFGQRNRSIFGHKSKVETI